jgi:hypothetical protein
VAQLSEVTDPGYLDGLDAWSLGEVRSKRDAVTEIETGLSYMRRVVQTRLDIVAAEQRHREKGTHLDVSDPEGELKEILAENVHAPGLGRLSTLMAPGRLDEQLERQMEEVLPSAKVGAVTGIDDTELAKAADGLSSFERTVSVQRRAVLDVLDRLQEEIVRRYRDGGASVDELLS